jgi:hypothetical protein
MDEMVGKKNGSVTKNNRLACAQHNGSSIRHSTEIFPLFFNGLPTPYQDAESNFSKREHWHRFSMATFRNAQCAHRDPKNAEVDALPPC